MNNNLVCHYTTTDLALQIIKSQMIRATDHTQTDDSTESRFLLEQINKLLTRSQDAHFRHAISKMMDDYKFYITCFTEHRHGTSDAKYGNLAMGPGIELEWRGVLRSNYMR